MRGYLSSILTVALKAADPHINPTWASVDKAKV